MGCCKFPLRGVSHSTSFLYNIYNITFVSLLGAKRIIPSIAFLYSVFVIADIQVTVFVDFQALAAESTVVVVSFKERPVVKDTDGKAVE
jgi:hypothetical protein